MASFLTAVVVHASDFDRPADVPGPICFKCRKRDQRVVDIATAESGLIVSRRLTCGTEGQISKWRGTFWDLSHKP